MKRQGLFVTAIVISLTMLLFGPVGSAPLASGAIRRLTDLSTGVSSFEISADGQRVVFLSYNGGATGLYSVPTVGGPVTQLAEAVPAGDAQTTAWRRVFAISPDSRSVLYFGRPDASATPTPDPGQPYIRYPGMGLYHVPIDGSTASVVVADDPRIHTFSFSPDGQRAIFATGTGTDNTPQEQYRYELYSQALSGAPAQRLNIPLPEGQSVIFDRWSVLQTGYVVYGVGTANYVFPYGPSMGLVDLYSVPIDGPYDASVKLTTCSRIAFPAAAFAISGNGQRIVFGQTDCDGNGALRSMTPMGESIVRLTPPATTGVPGNLGLTQDNRYVLYTLTETNGSQTTRDIYITPIGGPSSEIHLIQTGAALGVNPVLVGLASNGDWIAYTAPTSSASDVPTDLYVASRTGPTNSARLVTSAFPNSVWPVFSADSHYLIYPENGGMFQSLELTEGSVAISLGVEAIGYTTVKPHSATPRLLIRPPDPGLLYTVLSAGPGNTLIQISHGPVSYYGGARFTPDGQDVVYIGQTDGQLYITDADTAYDTATPICDDPPDCGSPTAALTTTATSSATTTGTAATPLIHLYLPALEH